ncbi:hypothetical protein P8605_48910, partial [Streptomyces sp. T-3]|nr:hypothetical protein [Streptomyces sp. T-3]
MATDSAPKVPDVDLEVSDPAPKRPDPALTALRRRVGAIAAATAARCAEEIPAYRELPAQVREGDLVTNTAAVLDLFLTTVA